MAAGSRDRAMHYPPVGRRGLSIRRDTDGGLHPGGRGPCLVVLRCGLHLVESAGAFATVVRWRSRPLPLVGTAPQTQPLQPPPGVYTYAGSGEEKLSFLATHQSEDGELRASRGAAVVGPSSTTTVPPSDLEPLSRPAVWSSTGTSRAEVRRALARRPHRDRLRPPSSSVPAVAPGHREQVRCTGHSQTTKTNMTQRGQRTFIGRTTVVVEPRLGVALRAERQGQRRPDWLQHEEVWIVQERAAVRGARSA